MASAIHFGLVVHDKLSLLVSVVLLVLGGVLLLLSVGSCCFWAGVKRTRDDFVMKPC